MPKRSGKETLDAAARTVRLFDFLLRVATAERGWDGIYFQGHATEPLPQLDDPNHVLAWGVDDVWGVRLLEIMAATGRPGGTIVSTRYDSNTPAVENWGMGTELRLHATASGTPNVQVTTNEPSEISTDEPLPPDQAPGLEALLDRVEGILLKELGRYGITSLSADVPASPAVSPQP